MDKLDAIAADYVGQSIIEMLYDDKHSKSQPFDQTLYTHPALFMVQYSMAQTLLAENFTPPNFLFGASLGEFVAATFADVANAEVMLFDLIKQARLFDSHCSGGAMLVVIDDINTFQSNPIFSGNCELAGINFDKCFAVSGLRSNILQIAEQLQRQDITHQILPVSIAFHSSHVDRIKETFIKAFENNVYRTPRVPVVSCASSMENKRAQTFSPEYWWNVIRQPIQFKQSLNEFQTKYPNAIYLDVGPSGNMATFAKYNLSQDKHHQIIPIMTPFDHDDENIMNAHEKLLKLVSQSYDYA